MKRIGLIAGTRIDTKFGIETFSSLGKIISCSVSDTPEEQTLLQTLNKIELTNKVQTNIDYLVKNKVDLIIIYCNSLSGAIDLVYLRQKNKIQIITPMEAYSVISSKHGTFGVIAANCQSVSNIEKVILSHNNSAIVLGYGNLNIVKDIEKGYDPNEIISKYKLVELLDILSASGSEIVLLSCTHFTYFYHELKKLTNCLLFEPSEEIKKQIKLID